MDIENPAAVETDVVICGSGSAGICAALWLAQSGVSFRMLERRAGPLKLGQADGVQCRTVEIFESFGISEELLRDACQVNELTFWSVDETSGRLVRTFRAPDTPAGLSHQPHVVLNQARVNGILLDKMRNFAPSQEIDYDHSVTAVHTVPSDVSGECYPLRVSAAHKGQERVFKAKYVLACDGAHSSVRRSLALTMEGDSSDAVWGVMDVYPRTNFPDIRRKSTIHSNHGALVLIPREGRMVRFYLQLPSGTDPKKVTLDLLLARAQSILQEFQLHFPETVWWSAYTIGQRLASSFSAADGRVLLTGDACHTHSPKAGQGMNVSLQDGYNIGWKLAQVLRGKAPAEVLSTYVAERQKVASDLIDFDRMLTKLHHESEHDVQAAQRFREKFLKSQKYMAGVTAKYQDSIITDAAASDQSRAKNIIVGMRFPSTNVVRYCDAKVMQIQSILKSDNRWRIIVFAGDMQQPRCTQRLNKLSTLLASDSSPLRVWSTCGQDPDTYIEPLLVIANHRTKIEMDELPEVFRPQTGKPKIQDLEKIFVDDENFDGQHGRAYETFGINKNEGAVVVVRPDQYVSLVASIENISLVDSFFKRIASQSYQ